MPIAKLMIINDKSQTTARRKDRPLGSSAFSAGWGRVLGLALLVLSAGTSYASHRDGEEKYASDIHQRAVAPKGMVTVIVQYRQMPNHASLRATRSRGATIKAQHHRIHAVTMRIPASMLATLAADPNVAYITPDRPVNMTWTLPTEQFVAAVESDMAAAQYALDGTGIGVAVIDSGISSHPDLNDASGNSRVVYSQSFVAGDSTTADLYGHGTHVAGLVGGTGASSGRAYGYPATYGGMAPNVNLINLRVLDQNGVGTDSQVIAAIEQAIALQNTYNIRVINMSLGRPVFESYTLDPVDQAVEQAWQAGIVVVVAAGNNGRYWPTQGYGTVGVPGNDPAVITVGATKTQNSATRVDDVIASYSSKGPVAIDHIVKPDLVAPGNRLASLRVPGSTLDVGYPQFVVAPSRGTPMYYMLSGTSMATPVVSGAVALMLQQNPTLSPDQVKARLMKTAWKGFGQFFSSSDSWGNNYNNEYDIFTFGAGYLDIQAALNNTDLADGLALSPTAVRNLDGTVTIVNTSSAAFGGTSVVWGAMSVVWGNSVVWGANTITSNSVVWGAQSVVWGATSVSGTSVVWGATSTAASNMAALTNGDDGDN
ncbi:MAG TPA: S8 family peptidase [Pyrinomonadaceae bacterium]|nr:S8 family peptidase [Pyrinomonadaceae bacterium]